VSDFGERLFRWSERLRAIAQTGLAFDPHVFDAERYREVLELAAEMQAAARSGDPTELTDEWLDRIGRGISGYVTPQSSVIAVVRNDRDEVLLLKRPDSEKWFPPAGWADVGRSGPEVAVKEVREETGYCVRPVAFLGCFDSIVRGLSPTHFFCLFWGCELVGGEMQRNAMEALDLGWFSREQVPSPLHGGDWWVEMAYAWRGERDFPARFDALPEGRLEELWR
jgi:8-oxo-dGTP pyrophosphatase MutT (NUDIX family)